MILATYLGVGANKHTENEAIATRRRAVVSAASDANVDELSPPLISKLR